MSSNYDAIILGSGMAGLGVAASLAGKGRRVLVISRSGLKGEATPHAAGMLEPLYGLSTRDPLVTLTLPAYRFIRSRVAGLEKKSGVKTEFKVTGILYYAESSAELKALRGVYREHKKLDWPVIWREPAWIRKNNPSVSSRILGAIHYPRAAKINPAKYQQALIRFASKQGVRFIKSRSGAEPVIRGGKVTGVQCGSRFYSATYVVQATGAWMPKMKPVRGQILLMKGKLRLKSIAHSLDGFYAVPWSGGRYLLGSTLENSGFRPQVTGPGVRSIKARAARLLPDARRLKAASRWAGLRPKSRIGLPEIGPSKVKGLYLAGGYYRNGILLGYYAGRLLAETIIKKRMPAVLSGYNRLKAKRK